MRRLFLILLPLLIAAALPATTVAAPRRPLSTLATDTPLPPCRVADEVTARTGYDAWATTLVDTIYRLPKGYVPPDLVPISVAGVARSRPGMTLRALVIDDLRALDQAARAAGVRIIVRSAYRSATYQRSLYNAAVRADGETLARRYVARPGHSEHQLGTTIDIGTRGGPAPFTHPDWSTTRTGAWVNANAWRFGFVRSYPKPLAGVVDPRTCYASEPWHFRYIGREQAAALHASGLTLREWLWARRGE